MLDYADFVAPGLLAAAAMNGAIFDATFGLFFKLKYAKTYEAVLATPLEIEDVAIGEVGWSLLRGGIYAGLFVARHGVPGDDLVVVGPARVAGRAAHRPRLRRRRAWPAPRSCGAGRTSTTCS